MRLRCDKYIYSNKLRLIAHSLPSRFLYEGGGGYEPKSKSFPPRTLSGRFAERTELRRRAAAARSAAVALSSVPVTHRRTRTHRSVRLSPLRRVARPGADSRQSQNLTSVVLSLPNAPVSGSLGKSEARTKVRVLIFSSAMFSFLQPW